MQTTKFKLYYQSWFIDDIEQEHRLPEHYTPKENI